MGDKMWKCEICSEEKNITEVYCFVFEGRYRKICHVCLKAFLDGKFKRIDSA